MIQNKFLYYKTLNGFQAALNDGQISNGSIAFIENEHLIWTHGTFFGAQSQQQMPQIQVDDFLSTVSTNPIQNKVITEALYNAMQDWSNLNIEIDAFLSPISTNPVQNKVIYNNLLYYATKQDFDNFKNSINTQLEKAKGYFSSFEVLETLVPNPTIGDWAIVDDAGTWYICTCEQNGMWTLTQQEFEKPDINLSEYVRQEQLAYYATIQSLESYAKLEDLTSKQDKLVSGVNIKTINGQSLLGSGNITISGNITPTDPDTPSGDGTKHVFLTQEEYDALETYDEDTIYFIIAQEQQSWVFGDTFPITLS